MNGALSVLRFGVRWAFLPVKMQSDRTGMSNLHFKTRESSSDAATNRGWLIVVKKTSRRQIDEHRVAVTGEGMELSGCKANAKLKMVG